MQEDVLLRAVDMIAPQIKQLAVYQTFCQLDAKMKQDSVLLELLAAYQKIQAEYTENVLKYGRYHPDNKDLQQQLVDYKLKIDSFPEFKQYQKCARELQAILDQIAEMMNQIFPKDTSKSCGSACNCHT